MNEEKLLIPVNMAVMFFGAKLEPNVMLSYIRAFEMNFVFLFLFSSFFIFIRIFWLVI